MTIYARRLVRFFMLALALAFAAVQPAAEAACRILSDTGASARLPVQEVDR